MEPCLGHGIPKSVFRARGVADAGGDPTVAILANSLRTWPTLIGIRQHSADGARAAAGRLRLGAPRLCGWFWRLDDLVRIFCRCSAYGPVSSGAVRRSLVAGR